MRFLVDRCAGRRLLEALRADGHDALGSWEHGTDPGDHELLARAEREGRVLVTIDTDFGHLVFVQGRPHAGLVRLPDVPPERRIALMRAILARYGAVELARSVVTVRGTRLRITRAR
jgi:predicted nuclease of predicted toxin-antitoxin system